MKPTEAAALLTIAAAYDNRKPDADQAKAWAMALDDLRFEDCRDVIVAHYKRSREWLMPVDVIGGVRRLREKRIADYGPIEPPSSLDPDDTASYARFVQDARRRIADGELTTPRVDAALTRRDVASLGQIGRSVPSA